MTTLITFILGLSVLLSFDWDTGAPTPNAWLNIAAGVGVAVILYGAYRYASVRRAREMTTTLLCPVCSHLIPGGSTTCPYCGADLR